MAAALSAVSLPALAEEVHITTNMLWQIDAPWFGGFSGAEVTSDGQTLFTVTDKGTLLTAQLQRKDDVITDVHILDRIWLKHTNGQRVTGRSADAEGLALQNEAALFVSFEQRHRVASIAFPHGDTRHLNPAQSFPNFPRNGGFEAIAIDDHGTLYAIPERPKEHDVTFPLYVFRKGAWHLDAHVTRQGPFRPVGADFDDTGHLYLLERAVSPLGMRSRIRRFDLAQPDLAPETLMTTSPAQFDNLEALTFWRDPQGKARLILIADDNFSTLLRTQIVELTVAE